MDEHVSPTWMVVPLAARVVRARCRKEEAVVVLRRMPVALPVMTDADAPVCARVPLDESIRGREWDYAPHLRGLEWIRHDGTSYWRPLTEFRGQGHLKLDNLEASLRSVREEAHSHSDWADWPFDIAKARFADRKVPLLEEEGMVLRYLHTDLDMVALAAATSIAGRLASIDGIVHVRCDEPVNEVLAVGLAKGKFSTVAVVPRAGHDARSREIRVDERIQVFRADAAAEASAYAREMAATLKVDAHVGRGLVTEGKAPFARNDEGALPAEVQERFVARSDGLVGKFARPVVEAWLDVRDAGCEPRALRDAFAEMFDLILETPTPGRLAILAWFEANRLLPDRYHRKGSEMPDEDVAALAEIA